jgi:hypothetical protein
MAVVAGCKGRTKRGIHPACQLQFNHFIMIAEAGNTPTSKVN